MSTVSDDGLRQAGLTRVEYEVLCEQLHREPNHLELGMFGVLWSEHCSYKTSKPLLRRLPSTGPGVLQGPGENAGAVDIGDGWACVFKVESHNHPSAIEPYHGAATGVGGILRDVIAMGARPVAILDSLRFGPLPKSRRHLDGVVAGIGAYGNCMGIPTVGGEIYFDPSYEENPLVNAMCVGLVRIEAMQHAAASGRGNSLLLVGSSTGRDGIQGASFASFELTESSHERRPAVQVADPFLEKCLLEACMQLPQVPGVIGVQDLGAAGLTSAVAEAAARAGSGARLDLDRVPRRESGMTPYEVMLSESQERMLVVVQRGMEAPVEALFDRWELHAVKVGEVTADGDLTIVERGEEVARIPVDVLTEGVPLRHLEARQRSEESSILRLERRLGEPPDLAASLLKLLGSPNLCSRWPVIRQYDHMVGNATLVPPGGDAALIRVPGTERAISVTIDGNGRYCDLDPYQGAQIAVCEAARNILATGARPLAVTDCLNFANPERPEIFWQLEES
ncbi:MAG: phosphoribosylformylglycinamidine synthase subunit PurL, partial [Candidatus Dormibacteraceae bacterium]